MAAVRELLSDALLKLDSAIKFEIHDLERSLRPIAEEAKRVGEDIEELRYEQLAAELNLYDEPSVWGTHFGPWMSNETPSGRMDRPPLEAITPACIAYWSTRMRELKHPALRARYADLVWDLSLKATGIKPPIEAARSAIDGYVAAIVSDRCDAVDESGDLQARALLLAASIEPARLSEAASKLREHAFAEADPEKRCRKQLDLLAALMQVKGKRQPATEVQALTADLRAVLEQLDAKKSDKFIIGDVAFPLADYYWSTQQRDDAKAVIRV